MKFMVLRQQDERSSEFCKEIEKTAMRRGGITFPFIHKGYTYDVEDAEQNLIKVDKYYTNLFHSNCRCHLTPISDENTVGKAGIFDDVDADYINQGTAGYIGRLKLASKNPGIIETYVKSKFQQATRWLASRL